MKLDPNDYQKLIMDICNDICPGKRCLLKTLIERLHPDPRLLLQLKCIEELTSSKYGDDWDAAISDWIDAGYAAAFAQAYAEAEERFTNEHIVPEFETIFRRILELVAKKI